MDPTDDPPVGFSWVDQPYLAALARPACAEDVAWLRQQGIEIVISLTEEPLRRAWINDAGLMAIHVPVEDMTPPTLEQIEQCLSIIQRAREQGRGVAIHCGAGLGRTGVMLASYFVDKGLAAAKAIAQVRKLRPGSIETPEQEEVVREFAKGRS